MRWARDKLGSFSFHGWRNNHTWNNAREQLVAPTIDELICGPQVSSIVMSFWNVVGFIHSQTFVKPLVLELERGCACGCRLITIDCALAASCLVELRPTFGLSLEAWSSGCHRYSGSAPGTRLSTLSWPCSSHTRGLGCQLAARSRLRCSDIASGSLPSVPETILTILYDGELPRH